ncbi:hypothetical protein V2I01_00085 [Micromonospora sp. BRA006-A]|nr:hypothetical protein [Micromonospora sp. BRA006-A]
MEFEAPVDIVESMGSDKYTSTSPSRGGPPPPSWRSWPPTRVRRTSPAAGRTWSPGCRRSRRYARASPAGCGSTWRRSTCSTRAADAT